MKCPGPIHLTTEDKIILLAQGMGVDGSTMRLMARASLEDSKQAMTWLIAMHRQRHTMNDLITYITHKVKH